MSSNTPKNEPSRRGFFRALLGEIPTVSPKESDEQRAWKQRASVLALKFGKNEARLARIGVKNPVLVEGSRFIVELTGTDATGDVHNLELLVDSDAEVVNRVETESSSSQEGE